MELKNLALEIASNVYPELCSGKFFAKVKNTEYYFSHLQKTEVEFIYRTFYDRFDFAFTVRCDFSLCDCNSSKGWLRLPEGKHSYSTPPLYVIQRVQLDFAPAQIVKRMIHFYRANTLVMPGYNHSTFTEKHLTEAMRLKGLHFYRHEKKSDPKFLFQKSQVRNTVLLTMPSPEHNKRTMEVGTYNGSFAKMH